MTPRKIRNMLIQRYDLYLGNNFTAGHRAAECRNILHQAEVNNVKLPEDVRLGCRFFVLLDDRERARWEQENVMQPPLPLMQEAAS